MKIFSSYTLGNITLNNRIVMSPLTRCRSINNSANALMAQYYAQRASAGLIISEGIAPSANGLGYARVPAIYTKEQTESWKQVTYAVRSKGGVIFAQLMHTGRVAHPLNMPAEAKILAPSAITPQGKIWTDKQGQLPYSAPQAMTETDIEQAINEFVNAANNAILAGFDGIEIHAANGYLIEQFINPNTNQRTDNYGNDSIENRCRFAVEVTEKIARAIGSDKVGIRISPFNSYNDMPHYSDVAETYFYLARQMQHIGIAYIHLSDFAAPVTADISLRDAIHRAFDGAMLLSGGYNRERAEQDLQSEVCDLVAFGRPFISNPDLVERLKTNAPLAEADSSTFYSGGAKGYTDYPNYE